MEKKLVPELRFPGFSGQWREEELGNIIEISKDKYNPIRDKENYKCIELDNLSQETGIILGFYNSKEQLSIKNKFKKDEVLFGKLRPYLKKYWYAEFDGVCSSEIWVLRGKKDIDNNYVHKLIQTYKFNYIANVSSGSKMPRADWSYMKEIPFGITSIKEQTKIANFFTLIDNKIEKQEEKITNLEEYKNGMLQKLFPKKGESIPELRFKGFTDPWELRNLGELVDISTGKLDANAMIEDGEYDFYTSGIKKYRIDTPAFEGPAITIAGNGATVGYMHLADGEFNAYQRTYVLEGFQADRQFLYSEISNRLPRKITEEARTGNIPYIVMDMLTNLNISLPVSEDEQIKIGVFIRQLDNLITLHHRRLEELKELKKGFMQKMFI